VSSSAQFNGFSGSSGVEKTATYLFSVGGRGSILTASTNHKVSEIFQHTCSITFGLPVIYQEFKTRQSGFLRNGPISVDLDRFGGLEYEEHEILLPELRPG
jgi:hypothetical protein